MGDFRDVLQGRDNQGAGRDGVLGPPLHSDRKDAVDVVAVFVEAVEGQIVDGVEGDDDRDGEPDGQPEEVENGMSRMFPEVPERRDEVVFDHQRTPWPIIGAKCVPFGGR
jgi:hypothetical protein